MTADIRKQINDALLSYCRGIDRLDSAAVLAAFHPGALLVDYGPEPIAVESFAEWVITSLAAKFVATKHRISNVSITFDGVEASVETYLLAYHIEPVGSGETLHTFDGRYLDHFTEVDGRWLIARRALRVDWSRIEPLGEPMRGAWRRSERNGPDRTGPSTKGGCPHG
jgi:hypothetical protein